MLDSINGNPQMLSDLLISPSPTCQHGNRKLHRRQLPRNLSPVFRIMKRHPAPAKRNHTLRNPLIRLRIPVPDTSLDQPPQKPITTVESLRTLMNETASKLPEYPVVMAMKGVGTSLGPQLMAEIGDVSRFTRKSAITAFAGVDPGVNESGTYEQKSVPTSKRGSADLRKTLFQVMDVLIKTHPQDDPVYQFLDKKRAQGKPYYVYMTAGANKFLRIYYGRVKEYLSSLPES